MNQRARDYAEKRDYIRMKMETQGTLKHEGRQWSVTCIDLSAKGMSVELDEGLKVGSRVEVQIASPHPTLPGLEAEAEVVRASRLDNGRYTLGLAVIKLR